MYRRSVISIMKNRHYIILFTVLLFASCKADKKNVDTIQKTGDAAIDQLSQLIAATPDDDVLYYERSKQFYTKELFDQAIEDMHQALKIDSLKPEYYHLLSDIYMDYYQSKESLQMMERARRQFPENIHTMLKLSETQLILKQYEEMQYTIQDIMIRDPQNAEAYLMLGMLKQTLNETGPAKSAFQTCVELDPEITDAWLFLGSLYEADKDPLALRYYKSATQVDSTNVNAWHAVAFYLQNDNKIDEALEVYRRINRLDRNYEPAFLNAGILFLERNELEQAYEQFNILVNINPKYAIAYYYRGLVSEKQGNTSAAKSDYQNALNFNPDYEKAKRALSKLSN